MPKIINFGDFTACDQTVLPDMSILKGQKLAKNAEIENLKCDNFGDFQTLCTSVVRTYFQSNLQSFAWHHQ